MLVLLATAALAADTDLDGVDDIYDYCSWEDDTVDIDGNGVADCTETLLQEFGMDDEPSMAAAYNRFTGNAGIHMYLPWDPDDLHGYPYSGSAMFANDNEYAFMEGDQCVQLTPGEEYTLTGRFAAMNPTPTNMHFGVLLYTDSDCEHRWVSTFAPYLFMFTYHTSFTADTSGTPVDVAVTFPVTSAAPYAKVRFTLYAPEAPSLRAWMDSVALRDADTAKGGDGPPGPPSFARSLARDDDNPSDDRSQGRDATE